MAVATVVTVITATAAVELTERAEILSPVDKVLYVLFGPEIFVAFQICPENKYARLD
jgi:hypothetical protein